MKKHHIVQILAAGSLWGGNAFADIAWSGSMYERAYHDLSAIDINQDGTDDFTFNLEIDTVGGIDYYYSSVPANGQIAVEAARRGGFPLDYGTEISASLDEAGPFDLVWGASEATLFIYGILDGGDEDYGGFFGEGYLGVSFEVDGSTHYGWIELSQATDRPSPENQYLYIHGWAYESTPDTPIVAGVIPEPSTGILTMVGSLSILLIARSRRHGKPARIPRLPTASTPPEEW
jgi:hypothetical protein